MFRSTVFHDLLQLLDSRIWSLPVSNFKHRDSVGQILLKLFRLYPEARVD
jgi:hypothetical protein